MKKVILIAMACFAIITCHSQTEKGSMFLGGTISSSGNSQLQYDTTILQTNNKYLNFSITPNFGYFIKDNLAIGGNLNFQMQNYYYNNPNEPGINYETKNINTTYGIGVFARYYKKIAGKFSFFINGSLGYNYEIEIIEIKDAPNRVDHINNYSITISPGVVYFISPKLGIQTSFGNLNDTYSTYKQMNSTDNYYYLKSNNYGVSFNLSSFLLGINFYF